MVHEIGHRIVSGEIAEGEQVPGETDLVKEFKVSRQAVREALKVLAAKRLIAPRRRTGTTVLPRASWNLLDPDVLAWHRPEDIDAGFLGDLVELRRVIEPAAAALAARRADPDRLSRMQAALDDMRGGLEDRRAFLEADAEFHDALLSATGNSLFERLGTIIRAILEVVSALEEDMTPSYSLAIEQHGDIVAAIARGDAEEARRAMESILSIAHGQAIMRLRKRAQRNAGIS